MSSIDSRSMALTYSSTATLSAATTPIDTADLPAVPADDTVPATTSDKPLELREVKASDAEESLWLFKKSWQLRGQIGEDMRDIARTLKMSMKDVLKQRPDLADTAFDFKLENGRLKMVDTKLEGADLEWLQKTLNGNFLLVDKVKAFRRDSVELLQTDALQYGLEPNADTAELGRKLDNQVQFMQLFGTLAGNIQSTLMPTGHYETQAGETFDLSKPINTATAFLPFVRQMAGIDEGLNYFKEDGTNTGIGLKMPNSYFSIGFELNKYLPDFDIESIGFHEMA